MGISSTDLALLSARAGVARFGASRFGFIPYDVEGALGDEPGEYVWHEIEPPTPNDWTLVCDSWVCAQSQKAAFEEEETATTGTVSVLVRSWNVLASAYETYTGADATVELTGSVDGALGTAVSDASGYATFSGINPQTVTASVPYATPPGWASSIDSGAVVAGETLSLTVSEEIG